MFSNILFVLSNREDVGDVGSFCGPRLASSGILLSGWYW
jgi:hypothetical protein